MVSEMKKSQIGRQKIEKKMAMNQDYINETIAQIAMVAAKAVVQALLAERGDGDELTRCRGDKTGVRPRLGGP